MIEVTVQGVVKRFGEVVALNAVDLQIDPGELFFLLGPSGCGKTTLLRCLAGFYIPEEGSVSFGDEDVTRQEPHKRNTGMMFQSYALWPHMTVAQNVGFGLEQRKVPRKEVQERVEEALASVHMEGYGTRKPNQLSGGQQQRIALARALVIRPRCLLLDEPLSNLDAKLRLEMRSEIRRVCKEFKLTTIYVTHDQKEALSVADRMAVLDEGEILQVGTPQELYRRPQSRFVADFIGETNFLDGTIRDSDGTMAVADTSLGVVSGVLANPDAPFKAGDKVLVSIRPECLKLDTMPPEENSFAGEIRDVTYYGELAQYVFGVGETPLKVFEMNPRHLGRHGAGQLYAWADPEDVVFVQP